MADLVPQSTFPAPDAPDLSGGTAPAYKKRKRRTKAEIEADRQLKQQFKRKRGRPSLADLRERRNLLLQAGLPVPVPEPKPIKHAVKTQSQAGETTSGVRVVAGPLVGALVGREVQGVLDGSFDAGYFLTVKIPESDVVLKGVVFGLGQGLSLSSANDIAPGVRDFQGGSGDAGKEGGTVVATAGEPAGQDVADEASEGENEEEPPAVERPENELASFQIVDEETSHAEPETAELPAVVAVQAAADVAVQVKAEVQPEVVPNLSADVAVKVEGNIVNTPDVAPEISPEIVAEAVVERGVEDRVGAVGLGGLENGSTVIADLGPSGALSSTEFPDFA